MSSPDAVRTTEIHTCLYNTGAYLIPTPSVCHYQSNQRVNISQETFTNQNNPSQSIIIQQFVLFFNIHNLFRRTQANHNLLIHYM